MPNTLVSHALLQYLLIPLVVLWVYHLTQRRYETTGERKREATLLLSLALIVCWGLAWAFQRFGVPDAYLALVVVALAVFLYAQRQRLFPYRFRCERCGVSLSIQRILYIDHGLCASCEPAGKEGERD
ncbi:MAG TPA: hypothetical protein VFH83_10725 [Spirochaetia bacterium]|nr:hypothetical protein [Spirochaetia bacterium]